MSTTTAAETQASRHSGWNWMSTGRKRPEIHILTSTDIRRSSSTAAAMLPTLSYSQWIHKTKPLHGQGRESESDAGTGKSRRCVTADDGTIDSDRSACKILCEGRISVNLTRCNVVLLLFAVVLVLAVGYKWSEFLLAAIVLIVLVVHVMILWWLNDAGFFFPKQQVNEPIAVVAAVDGSKDEMSNDNQSILSPV